MSACICRRSICLTHARDAREGANLPNMKAKMFSDWYPVCYINNMLACFNVMHEPICSGPLVSLAALQTLQHMCACAPKTRLTCLMKAKGIVCHTPETPVLNKLIKSNRYKSCTSWRINILRRQPGAIGHVTNSSITFPLQRTADDQVTVLLFLQWLD